MLFAAGGLVAIVGGVYGVGRLHGYQSYKEKAQSLREAALLHQREEDRKKFDREITLAINKERAKNELANRIRGVLPADTLCELPPDGVRWIDDVLGAATANIPGADATPPD